MTEIIAVTFREAAAEWIDHLEEKDRKMTFKPARRAGHVRNHLMQYLAGHRVCDLRAIDLQRLRWSLATLGDELASSVISTLRIFLDYAETRKWISPTQNPSQARIARLSAINRRLKASLDKTPQLAMPSLDRLKGTIARSRGVARTALHLLILAGLRGNEARALKCSDFQSYASEDGQRRWRLNIESAFSSQHRDPFHLKAPKTDPGERFVEVGPELRLELVQATRGREDHEYVLQLEGMPLTSSQLETLIRSEQIRLDTDHKSDNTQFRQSYTMRHFRHAFVALLIFRGYEDKGISVAVGHSSVVVTLDIYGYLFELKRSGHETWPSDIEPDADIDTEVWELAT